MLVASAVGAAAVVVATAAVASSAGPPSRTAEEVPLIQPAPSRSPTPTPTPQVVYEEIVESIPFSSTSIEDPNADIGVTWVQSEGAPGERVITVKVTTIDGRETGRERVSESIRLEPRAEVVANGSRVPPPVHAEPAPPPPEVGGGCHPSYADVCVPESSDVDCAGGSGNGPEYVAGPLRVIGPDVYDLDRDGDGIACDT